MKVYECKRAIEIVEILDESFPGLVWDFISESVGPCSKFSGNSPEDNTGRRPPKSTEIEVFFDSSKNSASVCVTKIGRSSSGLEKTEALRKAIEEVLR